MSLVHDADVKRFISMLMIQYLTSRIDEGRMTADRLNEVVFASKPASGGALLRLPSAPWAEKKSAQGQKCGLWGLYHVAGARRRRRAVHFHPHDPLLHVPR